MAHKIRPGQNIPVTQDDLDAMWPPPAVEVAVATDQNGQAPTLVMLTFERPMKVWGMTADEAGDIASVLVMLVEKIRGTRVQ